MVTTIKTKQGLSEEETAFAKEIKTAAEKMINEDINFQNKYNGKIYHKHTLRLSYKHQIIYIWKPIYSETDFNIFPDIEIMAKRKIQIFQFALMKLGLPKDEIPQI